MENKIMTVISVYVVYLVLAIVALPYIIFLITGTNGLPTILFMTVITPLLSFFIPYSFMKTEVVSPKKKIAYYVLHAIVVIAAPIAMLSYITVEIFKNIGSF